MNHDTPVRRGYVRPMQGWWRRDPFFLNYMLREITAIGVFVYAVILAVGAVRLSQGEAAWNGWLAALRTPSSILLHVLLLAAFAVHAHSWFVIMPKTMPMMFVGGHRVAGSTITRTGWTATVVASIALLVFARWLS
jgi:fumarate reductase subunit C